MARRALNIGKSHVDDAYAMGDFHPKKRVRPGRYMKKRRNNRILEKFYDARYVDLRDRKGQQLPCGRTRRSEPRHGPGNERVFRAMRVARATKRGVSVSRGRRSVRRRRYPYRPGDTVWTDTGRHTVKGVHNGTSIKFVEADHARLGRCAGTCSPTAGLW